MTAEERLLEKVSIDQESGCWNWTGAKNEREYGRFHFNGKNARSHRASYQIFTGEIPEGYEIDHKCNNTLCCNPQHLQAVTGAKNLELKHVRRLSEADAEALIAQLQQEIADLHQELDMMRGE